MPTWLAMPLIVVGAVGVLALVWWSSGRSPLRGRGPGSEMTPDQRLQMDRHRLDTALRPNTDSNPNNPGGR